eukprot:s961_g15.t2
MPRLAVLRPPASSDVSVEAGNVSTVVLGNERVAVDAILDDDGCVPWASTAMLESALEGFSHGLVLHGASQGQLIPRLLLQLGDRIQERGCQLWFTALELLDDQILDLLATGPLERKEPPRFVLHPGLGMHVVSASEMPIFDHAELKELISFSQKRRVLTSSCLHAASSRSHQLYFLRLEGEKIHCRLGIFDLRSSAPSRSVADLTTLESLLQGTCHHLLASKLTMALKDLITGTWHQSVLATEGSRSSFRWLKAWARPRLLCSLMKGLPRSAQLELLQGEVQALKSQPSDETRSEALAQRSALILEFSKKPLDRRRLARERVKTCEWCGVMTEETQDVLQQELMTPYLLNMSDDASLAGCLMYQLQRGERTSIGSDPDNTIVLDGLGMLPNLCSIVNVDDFKLTLSRPDFAKDHVLVNGKTMAKDSIVLSHHDRICLGRAQMLKLHIPHQGVETIQEGEEKLGLQPLECLLPEELTGFLPPLPRQGFEVNFSNLQHLLEHSESLRNLQYYVKDLLPKLSATAQLACFQTLRKACYQVDEANMITREVRPEDQLHFEVDLVWDIFRHPEEVTFLSASFLSLTSVVDLGLDEESRVLCHQPVTSDALHNLVELCAGAGLSSVGFSRVGFRQRCAVEHMPWLADLHRQIHHGIPVVCADITKDSTAAAIFDHCPEPCVLMCGIACQPFSQGGLQLGENDDRAGTLPGALRIRYLLQAPVLTLECVQPARSNQFVQDHIHALEWQLGMHVTQCSLRLENVWAACRLRWWMVATDAGLGKVKIPDFPTACNLVVRDLMPIVPRWTATEEDQLRLSAFELERFQLAKQPLTFHEVKADKKLPTALHSWGGQVQACACGCRPSGFSDSLLTSKGVYAQLVKLPATDEHPASWRHLHVLEVSLLSGVPLDLTWGSNARLNLCAIGQMAAPMHAIWIATSIARHIQALFTSEPLLDHAQTLNALKQDIWKQSKDVFRPEIPRNPQPESSVSHVDVRVFFDRDLPCVVRVPAHATVSQLIQAESRLHGLAPHFQVLDDDGLVIPMDLPLANAPTLRFEQLATLPSGILPDQEMSVPATALDVEQPASPAPPLESSDRGDVVMPEPQLMPQALGETVNLPVDGLIDSLLQLTPNQLMALLPPIVVDPVVCRTMRRNVLSHEARFTLLGRQESVWADDEVWWHLRNITPTDTTQPLALLDPLLATSWCVAGTLDLVRSWLAARPSFTRLASVVLIGGHWIPCLWFVRISTLEVHVWEHDQTDIDVLNPLHGLLSQALGLALFHTTCTRRNFGLVNCGAAAIAFLQSRLADSHLPGSDEELRYTAVGLRTDFTLEHESANLVPRPWIWGGAITNLDSVVSTLLQQHGVPSTASASRAKLVLQALGRDQVSQAVLGTAPWKSLKAIANQQTPVLQLVLPDELSTVVEERKRANAGRSKKQPPNQTKGTRLQPQKPVDIDPSKLELADETFCLPDGTPVKQIQPSHLGPLASGIALVTFQDALQFLQSGRVLTRSGLAMLVLNGPTDLRTDLQWSTIRFAAKCSVNQQPVLLSGFLVQLGEQTVCPFFRSDGPEVPSAPVSCARITTYRDQFQQDWEVFSEHPFRHILALLPPLQTCHVNQCQCPKWHPTAADGGDVLLDVFRRQFFTETGRPTKASQASHFSVQIRFLKTQETAVLRLSGQNGIYVEPRLPDASSPSDEFQVVWLPQATVAVAQHEAQCEPLSLGIARTGRRYGLRVPAQHFQQIFQKLKPEGQFLAPGVKQNWLCGPWPYGTDRKSLGKIFAEWNWQARPLQPAKPIEGGVMWLIQSVVDPPQAVWNLRHGQVVVSKCESASTAMKENGAMVGPEGTVDLCSTASATDPWLERDPWQQTLKTIPVQQSPNMVNQLQEMEDRLEKSLLEKLPQERMDTDENEQRILQLEQQMQTLAQRHQTLENTVIENHRQNTAQVQSLQTQMLTQMEAGRVQMSHMFEEQMTKLETILAKKGRYEANSAYRYVVSGAPLSARSQASRAGHYSGVALIAKHPSRALCASFPEDMYETGRVLVACSLVQNTWITGAVLYGYPQGKTHHQAYEKTIGCLDALFQHMTQVATGPRYFTGDWNWEENQLPVCNALKALGWREVQDLEYCLSGTPVKCTCKRATRKDFLWLSPELVACYRGLVIDDTRFPDHVVIKATFSLSKADMRRYLWPMPLPVPWTRVAGLSQPLDFQACSPTQGYMDLWTSKETLARQTLGEDWTFKMGGRGQRLEPMVKKGWISPPRKGRSCDAQPNFHGYHVTHARWIKQLRRLQNYDHWATSHFASPESHLALHGLLLWKSILGAKGFGESFQLWWKGRRCVGLQDPGFVPDYPPPPAVARSFCETFACEVDCLERRLNAAKKSARISQHQRNPNLLYQDTRRPMPEPVSTLLSKCKAQITEVDFEDVAVEVTPSVAFDPSKPVTSGPLTIGIIHVEDTRLYLEDVSNLQPGMTVCQSTPVGALDDVFEAFHTQWKQRWCKHDEVPHERWTQLVEFARSHLPCHPLLDSPITPELLRAEVARKKPKAATGLDGVSRLDILQADHHLLASLCSMYRRAGQDGCWPEQVLTGRVASLAKVDSPESASDYRPITIFSMCYRAFSSLKARALLDWANEWCHPDIYGNRKGHQTSQLWRVIVNAIQTSYDTSQPVSGLMADIEKCFNCLPRWPILAAAVHTGVPPETCCAWAGALAGMTRRFRVRDSFSTGFSTSTGLAEGCALSCFGMLLLDDMMHRFIHHSQPAIRVLSFVDDWSFLTPCPQAAERQLDILLEFANLADLTVDRRKTFLWSTCPTIRGRFRQIGVPVVHHAKDLGAHLAFSRQRTNKTVVDRLEALQPLWRQLKYSKASYHSKLRALRTVAWPRGLYAIESAPVAVSTWTTHRRLAVQSLQFDKPGVNPLLLLGLVESYVDPEFLASVRTVSETRLSCPLDFWASDFFLAASGCLTCAPSAPLTVLLERVLPLGFSITSAGLWQDRVGLFHPGSVNYTELCHRLQWTWNQVVASRLAYRKDFSGLGRVDVLLTRSKLAKLPPDQQALMRLSLAGGLFTQDAHSHWNGEGGTCKWCGALDSLQHRYFECPNTRDLRESLAPLVVKHRDSIPDAMALRSWAILPPTHWTWLSTLDAVPSGVPVMNVSLRPGVWNHVFTDGSCLWQSDPSLRVAAWGVLLADPFTSSWTFTCKGVVASGCLPGLCQSAFRAELYALAVVLHHASTGGFRVKIYSDCLGVVNKYHLFTRGSVSLKLNSANGDLWRWILNSLTRLGDDQVMLCKTPAHRKVAAATTRYEAWLYWNNNAVDQVARLANVNRPRQFWNLWEAHAREVFAVRELYDQVCAFHLAVAQRSVLAESERTLDEYAPDVAAPRPVREFVQCFEMNDWQGHIPLPFANEYGSEMSRRLGRWWMTRTQCPSAGPIRWITLAHLYVDYQLTWGCPGPIKHGSRWLDATLRPYLEPEKHDFLQRLKWFKRCMKLFWKATGQQIAVETCRGTGEAIQSFVAAASVCWSHSAWEVAESWKDDAGDRRNGGRQNTCLRRDSKWAPIRLMSYSNSPRTATTSSQVLHYWSYAQFQARLELLRDAHRAATRSTTASVAKDELMDAWRESNNFPLRHLLSHALFDRPDKEVEDLKMQLAEMRQELQEKTESLEKKAEIISQLNEQLMGVVSLTQEIQEEVGLQSPHGASPIMVETKHDRVVQNDGSEENFTMSVSASTISDARLRMVITAAAKQGEKDGLRLLDAFGNSKPSHVIKENYFASSDPHHATLFGI